MELDDKIFAVAVGVMRMRSGCVESRFLPMAVVAKNQEEAIGKGFIAVHKAYPASEGWQNHGVSAVDTTDPDKLIVDVKETKFTVNP